jgi:predicted small metal-binding protein
MRTVCPREGCEYIAFGDNEKELRRDLRYHLMSIHNCHDLPDRLEVLEDVPAKR